MTEMPARARVAVVTGGANGIGRAVVQRLAAEGHQVAVLDRETATATAVATEISGQGGSACAVEVDVADPDACTAGVSAVLQRWGRIDYLVNSAGSFIAKGVDATASDWDQILAVNVRGMATMVAAVAPAMRTAGGGAIVNVSSVSAHVAQPSRWTYNATKGAITSMTRCQALDLAPWGIRVNSVAPGWTWTREVLAAAGGDRAAHEPAWGRYAMLGRLAEPAEIAAPICFLLGPDASFITGTELAIDGGYLGMGPEGDGGTSTFAGSS